MVSTGLPASGERSAGRDSQSMAFFITPDMPLLYSGETATNPSHSATAWRNSETLARLPRRLSSWIVERNIGNGAYVKNDIRRHMLPQRAYHSRCVGCLTQAATEANEADLFMRRAGHGPTPKGGSRRRRRFPAHRGGQSRRDTCRRGAADRGCAAPTPAGVPIMTMSPGSSVMHWEMRSMASPTPKIIIDVLACCINTSLT